MTGTEVIAVIFGLLCVGLTIRQNIWCWPTGLIQVVLYIAIFYRVKLYSDMILHAIYVVLQIYGWYHWLYGGKDHGKLAISKMAFRGFFTWICIAVGGTIVWGWGMATLTDAALPYWDAFIIVSSLIAQWLMTRKQLESWIFWILVDIVAIGVYFYKSLFLTSGLYAVFLVLASMGFIAWRNSLSTGLMDSVSHEDGIDTRKIRPTP